jgi:hypothetical protein
MTRAPRFVLPLFVVFLKTTMSGGQKDDEAVVVRDSLKKKCEVFGEGIFFCW